MDQAEWLACTDLMQMLDFVRRTAGERKLRLFGVGCCRELREQLNIRAIADALEATERFADTAKTKAALRRAGQGVKAVRHGIPNAGKTRVAEWAALWLAEVAASENAFAAVGDEVVRLTSLGLLDPDVQRSMGTLMHCVFGNPLRPASPSPPSHTPAVTSVARAIYDSRCFDRMLGLADALEDAGCTDAGVLAHCRRTGRHVRGCWVLDLILGKD